MTAGTGRLSQSSQPEEEEEEEVQGCSARRGAKRRADNCNRRKTLGIDAWDLWPGISGGTWYVR